MSLERRGRRVAAFCAYSSPLRSRYRLPQPPEEAEAGKEVLPTTEARPSGDKRDKLAFFDSRQTPAAEVTLRNRDAKSAASPNPATDSLKDSLGSEAVVSIDPLTSTPRMVGLLNGFLTRRSSAPPASIALDYVNQNASALGLDAKTVAGLELARDYVDVDGGHHLFFVQKANGIPVFGNGLKANVTSDGRLINVLGSPVGEPEPRFDIAGYHRDGCDRERSQRRRGERPTGSRGPG